MTDDRDVRTDAQKEWAAWAAHGYRKLYQPRSILRLSAALAAVLGGGLFLVFYLAAGRLP